MEGTGYLNRCRYLVHDRDTKFCPEFRETLAAAGVKWLAPASTEPKFEFLRGVLGTFGKRGVSKLILFEEHSLRRAFEFFSGSLQFSGQFPLFRERRKAINEVIPRKNESPHS